MSERKSMIHDQITNSILSILTAIPVIWLLNKHTVLETEYLACYCCVYLFTGVLIAALDRKRMLYIVSALIPVAVLAAFRDIPLFLNCLAAMGIFALCMLLYSNERRRLLMAPVSVVLLVLCMISRDIPRIAAAAIVGMIILSVALLIKSNLRYALTIVILIECVTICISMDAAERMWKKLAEDAGRFVSNVEEQWNDVKYYLGRYDRVSYMGYGEPGGMTQSLNETRREELYVRAEGKVDTIYLKGASYSDITKEGVNGRIEENAEDNSWFALYLNDLYHVGITKEEADSFSKILKVNVEYAYIRTKDIMRSSDLILLGQTSEDEIHGKDYRYSFHYVALDYANQYLEAVVRQSNEQEAEWESYDTIRDYVNEIYQIDLNNIMDENTYNGIRREYKPDDADDRYLDDSFVTDRIRELTLDITKDCTNDYDRARMIEAYLRQYPYDMNVDYRGEDHYVEAFLFEEGRGYCVHYASAMTVMLRSIGIPARYTQGFKHETSEGIPVYSNEAHAWAEAYIKGYGWIAFEPTGFYASAYETGWGLLPENETEQEAMASEINTDKDSISNENLANLPDIPAHPEEDDPTQDVTAIRKDIQALIWQIGRYLMGLIGIAFLFYLIYRIYEAIRYRRMSATDKVRADIASISRKMDHMLPPGTKALSVFDYLPYVQAEGYDLNVIFTDYYRIRFRGDEPDPEYVTTLHGLAGKRYKRTDN